jgi:hypothetical protein
VDVAKQLDERDAAHKAEVEQLKGRITELLDEKEEREGDVYARVCSCRQCWASKCRGL